MTPVAFLLRRYLIPRQGNLLSFALWLSVLGVALGIAQLMLVLSVMSGFQRFLSDHYTKITSELVVIPRHSHETTTAAAKVLRGTKEVAAFTPFRLAQAMVLKDGVGGVTIEGIDLATTSRVTPWEQIWSAPPVGGTAPTHRNWIWLGRQLAKKLKVKVGDTVDVLVPSGNKSQTLPFVVTAITSFGIYDHDLRYARIALATFESIYGAVGEPLYKTALAAGVGRDEVARKLNQELGESGSVRKWNEIHRNIFEAVAHQKALLFLVLEIVVLLAAMNVVNLLMMSSQQRKRDTAILRAMGMRFGEVFSFFLWQGAAVGTVGIFFGVFGGWVLCFLVERFQPSILSESVYNVTRLPIRVELTDVAMICLGAFVLCVICSVIPALRAAKQRPVEALRYE